MRSIGLYRENAIAIKSEAKDPFCSNVYYVTMQITLPIPEFTRNERNLHCDVLPEPWYYTLPPIESPDSFLKCGLCTSYTCVCDVCKLLGTYCSNFS